MNKLPFALVLLVVLSFFSCKTDIDINAEPTDITVVYGLLNPNDTIHYLKINKAFLGDGSALDLASNANNYDYAEDVLNVTIEGNGNNYTLTRVVNEIPKDAGIFDDRTNVLYKFTEPSINKEATYKLRIINTKLNKEITAKTKIIGNSNISAPKVTNNFNFWKGPISSGNYVPETVTISAGENVARIQVFIIFNYIEHYTTASAKVSVAKKVIINLGEKKTGNSSENKLNFSLKGSAFFDQILAVVPNPSTIANFSHRELDNISIEFSVAETELSTYMEAKAPSTTVNQDKPNYTNITNGIGIFSSRTYDASWQTNKTASNGLNMDTDTKRYLGALGLGFCLGTSSTATIPCNQHP